MNSKSYLIFNLGNSQYGIEARLIKEIFPLPELESLPEAPTDIIGILNLRGEILPVMHLALRLGRSAVSCQIGDRVVVMNWQGLQIGMVVDLVQELQTIDDTAIQAQPDYGRAHDINPVFITGIAKLESNLVVLLDPETLVRQPDEVASLIWEDAYHQSAIANNNDLVEIPESSDRDIKSRSDELGDLFESELLGTPLDLSILSAQPASVEEFPPTPLEFGDFYQRYCPHVTDAERAIFRQRAENLRQPLDSLNDATGLYPLAVVNLGGERFGIDLSSIQEFTSIRNLTPIPCCPRHIVGNMNLRGEIVTLVDIREVLNLTGAPVKVGAQTAIVRVKDIVAGLPVDSVSDVLYVNPAEIKPVPIAISADGEGYLQGTISIFNQVLGILDLSKMMTQGALVVDEAI